MMNKEEYYSRLKKTTSKLLTDRCSYEENHNIALQQIYLKDKYIETLEKENQQLKKQKDDVVELIIKLYQKEYNKTSDWWLQEELCNNFDDMNIFTDFELERMLGEIDEFE